eukprot:1589082-Rhodomonas_salina.2
MSSTDVVYGATRNTISSTTPMTLTSWSSSAKTFRVVSRAYLPVRAQYTTPGTDTASLRAGLAVSIFAIVLRARYAMSGTYVGYAATPGQHLLFGNPDDVWAEELIARLVRYRPTRVLCGALY